MKKNITVNKSTIRFLILIAFFVACWITGSVFHVDFASAKAFLLRFPLAISGGLFTVLYVLVTLFVWLAKDLFKILGAVVFGAYISTLLIWLAEIINTIILFHISRCLGRGFIEQKLGGKLTNLDKKIERSGFWGLCALRIVPLVPFRFLDLAAGLTTIPFRTYLFVSIFASPLRIFWIQFILAGIGESALRKLNLAEIMPALTDYLMSNRFVYLGSVVYFIAAIGVLMYLRRRS